MDMWEVHHACLEKDQSTILERGGGLPVGFCCNTWCPNGYGWNNALGKPPKKRKKISQQL